MSGNEVELKLPARTYNEIAERAAVEGISVDEFIRRLLVQGMDGTVRRKQGTVIKFAGPHRP